MAKGFPGKSGKGPWRGAVLLALGLASAAPAVAQTAENEFLQVLPLPDGIEAVGRIPGAVNVRFQDCEAAWPAGYRTWLAESVAVEGHARKRDIYSWLRAKQAFDAKNCSCEGKVADWDDVDLIFMTLQQSHGRVLIKHTADFAAQADVLTAVVERMCGGPF